MSTLHKETVKNLLFRAYI